MLQWLIFRWLRLRAWLLVRLGLWRGQWRRGRVTVEGVQPLAGPFGAHVWRYGLYAPAALRDDEAAPLLLVLHGCKQRALGFAFAAGLTRLADRSRLRLLCPQQRRLANLYRCWNWFLPQAQRGDGELRVIRAMLDDVAARVQMQPGAVAAIGLSAGGGLAALLAFHLADRIGAVAVIAAPPLLGPFNMQDPRDVMRRGLLLPPASALGLHRRPCAPLAIVHGAADAVVHPKCAEQLQAQALESLRRGAVDVQPSEARALAGAAIADYRSDGALRLRRIEVAGLGHEWSGGPGGHPYCVQGGTPLAELCAQFFRDAGVPIGSPGAR
jgi:poly(hydroxyalkanoate) depolymerase family esterase